MSLVVDSCIGGLPCVELAAAGELRMDRIRPLSPTLYTRRDDLPTAVGLRFFAAFPLCLERMKTFTLISIIALSIIAGSNASAAEGKKTLYHVVTLKFKPDAAP